MTSKLNGSLISKGKSIVPPLFSACQKVTVFLRKHIHSEYFRGHLLICQPWGLSNPIEFSPLSYPSQLFLPTHSVYIIEANTHQKPTMPGRLTDLDWNKYCNKTMFSIRASADALGMWSWTVKLDEKIQHLPVWLRKMVSAQHNCLRCHGC